ncbi:MAG: TfpX/TfpZ family type IV pilin accessory protein [Undibacterium sp.]|uniref:TfpX/TfpZ family type IV pilin accessory protein n=1 Tax=Undibacterium sp. TaxID=1914977 RepID=UPI002724D4FA|nr:TfpX/TfpZ family type IV pilin accessory protein [Undibacterium sp.]MDO8654430.1 TfpX/TfpZ family type IV pilin accessory protein [Undibacterium sp.]
MNKFLASGFHFLISLFVGLVLLALCWFVWYPAPMLMAIGGLEIFLLVVGIDVVLGPLLTLVVFKSGKKSLKFDLAVIAMVQLAALSYGVSTLLEARPAYVAALGGHFQVIQASELTDVNLAKAKEKLSWWGPKLVGTKPPTDKHDISDVDAMSSVGAGRGHLPHLHIPYENMNAEILQKASDISVLDKNNPTKQSQIHAWLLEHHVNENSVKFQPIKISASVFAIILDAKSAKIIGIMPIVLIM